MQWEKSVPEAQGARCTLVTIACYMGTTATNTGDEWKGYDLGGDLSLFALLFSLQWPVKKYPFPLIPVVYINTIFTQIPGHITATETLECRQSFIYNTNKSPTQKNYTSILLTFTLSFSQRCNLKKCDFSDLNYWQMFQEELDLNREVKKLQITHCCLCLLPDGVCIQTMDRFNPKCQC